jgi:RND superfamily putative drug exporter
MATLGLVAIPSQFVPMDDTVSSVVLLVGLAVGVDYTLFYLRREREEKARGATKMEAVHTAAATSGRAVLVSGFTVMVAMAGMFFAGGRTFTALGVGAIMVVAVAVIGSLTVVPAVLAWLGDRVEKGRVPFLHGRRNSTGESRAWGWVLSKVLKRPVEIVRFLGIKRAAFRRPCDSLRGKETEDLSPFSKKSSSVVPIPKLHHRGPPR